MTMKFKSFSAAVISALVVMVPMQASALTKQQQDAMISGGKSAHAQKLRAETAHLTKSTGRDLTVKEQRETEGAFAPALAYAAVGAVGGVATYRLTTPASQRTTTGYVVSAAVGAVPLGKLGQAAGAVKNWVRVGPTFSKAAQQATVGIRWGASPAHVTKVPSPTLQEWNQALRNTQLPGNSWRTADRGHLHLWRR